MIDLINTLPIAAFSGDDIPALAIIAGCSVGALAIALGTICSVMNKREEEQTKREIAAYVAEGSITPDDAQQIIASRPKGCGVRA